MITKEQANELEALIGVYRTKAIRAQLVRVGKGGPNETPNGTTTALAKAQDRLAEYIDSLTVKEGG